MAKQRTAADELRDFITGKIGDGYYKNIKYTGKNAYTVSGTVNVDKITRKVRENGEGVEAAKKTPLKSDPEIDKVLFDGTKANENFREMNNNLEKNMKKHYEKYQKPYYEKHKGLSTYEEYMTAAENTDDDLEKQWLMNKAEKAATSKDYQAIYDKKQGPLNEINKQKAQIVKKIDSASTFAEKKKYNDEAKRLDDEYEKLYSEIYHEREQLKTKIEKKKLEEELEKYHSLTYNADFSEKSKAEKTAINPFILLNPDKVEDIYTYLNSDYEQKDASWYDSKGLLGASDGNKYGYMTDNEKNIFNYLYNTKGKESAKQYADILSKALNERMTAQLTEGTEKFSRENPVEASLLRPVINLGSGRGVGEDIVNTITGKDIDPNSAAHSFNHANNAIINTVNTEYTSKWFGGATVPWDSNLTVGEFIYNTANSAVDSAISMKISGTVAGAAGFSSIAAQKEATSVLTSGIIGSQSATQTIINSKEKGLPDENAVAFGIVSGLIEGATEKWSIDNIFSDPKRFLSKHIKNDLVRAFISEGSEEVASNWLNNLADRVINGDKSEMKAEYNKYILSGCSGDEALANVLYNSLGNDITSFLSGGISGLAMSGVSKGINYTIKSKNSSEIGKEALASKDFSIDEVINDGKNSSDERAAKLAAKLEKQNNSGKKLNPTDVGNLMKLISPAELDLNADSEPTLFEEEPEETTAADKKLGSQRVSDDEIKREYNYAFGKNHKEGIAVKSNLDNKTILTVTSIRSSSKNFEDGENVLLLETSEGKLVNADKVTATAPHFNQLFSAAKNFNTYGAQALAALYEEYADYKKERGGTADMGEYLNDFTTMYELGQASVSFNSVKTSGRYASLLERLGAGRANIALNAGYKDSSDLFRNEYNKARRISIDGKASGVLVDEGARQYAIDDEQKQILQAISEKIGREIVLTSPEEFGENQNAKYENGKIYIRADLEGGYAVAVALHEATHGIRQSAPAEYRALRDFVVNYLVGKGENLDALLNDIKTRWGNNAQTKEDRVEELVCQTVMAIATDETALRQAVSTPENKGLISKVAQVLKKIAQNVYNFMKGLGEYTGRHNLQAQAWLDDVQAIRKLADYFSKAADAQFARTSAESNSEQKNNAQKGAKYQIDNIPNTRETEENIKAVTKMKPVAILNDSEFSKGNTDLITQVTNYFKSIGGYVNTNYGRVELTKSGAKSSIAHGLGRNKAIAFKAVPEVLKNGKIIDFKNNWKNRGYDTAVIVAPIKIANTDYFLAAVIKIEPTKNTYYLHEVAIQKKEDNTLFKTGTVKNGTPSKVLSSPINTLLQKLKNVNNNSEKNNSSGNSDIRYAIDDTITDSFFDEDGDLFTDDGYKDKNMFEKAVKTEPSYILNMVYNASAKTAESGIKLTKDVKLDDPQKAYQKIARTVMKKYKIDYTSKGFQGIDKEFAEEIESFAGKVSYGKYTDFATLLEDLADKCRDNLTMSGKYDTSFRKEERDFVLGLIQGKSLVIPERNIEQIKEDYGSVANYRKRMFGKTNVVTETSLNKSMVGLFAGNLVYVEDVIGHIEEQYPYLLNENADGDMGFLWLENLVNDTLAPKFVSAFSEDFDGRIIENIDSSALQMAFDVTTNIIDEYAKQLVIDKNADKKQLRELAAARKKAIAEREAIYKAKIESYRQRYNNEHSARVEEIKNLKEQLQEVEQKDKARADRQRKKIVLLEEELRTKKDLIDIGYDTIRRQYNEGRDRTVYMQRLGKLLDHFTKMLDGKTNNNLYIPETLKEPILNVLRGFVIEPGMYKNGKAKRVPGYFGEYKNIQEVGKHIDELTAAYLKLKPKKLSLQNQQRNVYSMELRADDINNPSFIDLNNLNYSEDVYTALETLRDETKGKNLYDLDSYDLKYIYETLLLLDERLRDAVSVIMDGQKVMINKVAAKTVEEVKSVRYSKKFSVIDKAIATQLDPVRYARFLSGYHEDYYTYKIFAYLHEGEKKSERIMKDCITRAESVILKYSDKEKRAFQREEITTGEKDNKKPLFEFKDLDTGKRVKISQGMAVAIYLTDRQEAGHRHLVNEKYTHWTVIPDLDLMNINQKSKAKGEKSHRVRFSEGDLRHIAQYVNNNEMCRDIAEVISEVYNKVLKEEINEVSMKKYGKLIATVDSYYPLTIDQDGAKTIKDKEFETVRRNTQMKSRGFTHQRVYSTAPIVIDDVLNKFVGQVSQVSEYCGMLIPIENFRKVYNSGDGYDTVHTAIRKKFGSEAEHYINKLMGDLQNVKDKLDYNWLNKMQGNFMGAKLLANPGAMLKQYAVYPTANKYFGVANVSKAAVAGTLKVDLDLYSKYTPYLWYRKEGNGTVIGELSREMGFTKKFPNNFLDIMGKLDRHVVGSLLYAAELHVEQTTDLKKGTDAFYKEVARQFEKCIDETQPNNMVTSKPQFIRNNVMKILSLNAFRSQNMAISNGLIDSFMEYAARRSDYKLNKNSATKAAKNEAAKNFVSTVTGAVGSAMLIGGLQLIVDMLIWHKYDDYKDDEGELNGQNTLFKFVDYTLQSLTDCFAWGNLVYEALKAKFTSEQFYGLEVMGVENINDAINNFIKGDWWSLVALAADCTGFPGDNLLKRLPNSVYSYWLDLTYGNGRIVADNKGEIDTTYLPNYILEAKQKGDSEKAERYEDLWKEQLIDKKGKSEKEAVKIIKHKLVTVLAANCGEVEQAALKRANGDLNEYKALLNKVVGYGFDSNDVQKAVDRVIKNVKDDLKNRGVEEKEDVIKELIAQGFSESAADNIYRDIKGEDE